MLTFQCDRDTTIYFSSTSSFGGFFEWDNSKVMKISIAIGNGLGLDAWDTLSLFH
jgi:hypothetical protein